VAERSRAGGGAATWPHAAGPGPGRRLIEPAGGREMVLRRKAEHLIHNKDGTIGERNSYASDPGRRKG
jgi:hypothetical protein